MNPYRIFTGLITTFVLLFTNSAFADEASATKELEQIIVFDQTCIIMHTEGRKYLENKEKIAQSYGASALIEKHLEMRLKEYSELTGNNIDATRDATFDKGVVLFKELSKYQPRDLVMQCKGLVEEIVKTNI